MEYRNILHAPSGPHWRRLHQILNTHLLGHERSVSYSDTRTQEIHTMMKLFWEQSEMGWRGGEEGNGPQDVASLPHYQQHDTHGRQQKVSLV